MHFLYPSDPFRTRRPDTFYAEELAAMNTAGFAASVFSLEAFQAGSFVASPPLPAGTTILYRGWMLSSTEYEALCAAIVQAGANPFTDPVTYLAAHHLPRWYPLLAEFTPETRVFTATADLAAELRQLGWPAYFIKDYVKSLKTSVGSLIFSPEQANTVAEEMRRFRGTIEGGFCVRRVEDFRRETERRFFVLDHVAYSASGPVPDLVSQGARRIPSRFFSVDVVQRADGTLRIVEVGDGQVSDLVGWMPEHFAAIFHFAPSDKQP